MAAVFVMVRLDELHFVLLAVTARFQLQYGRKFVWLGQFVSRFQVIAPRRKFEFLFALARAHGLQLHRRGDRRLGRMSVAIEEMQTEARWHVGFEHTQFDTASPGFHQQPAMGSVRSAFEVIVMFGAMLVRVVVLVSALSVAVHMGMMMLVLVRVGLSAVRVLVGMRMRVAMFVFVRQMHVELRARNCASFLPRNMNVVFVQPELFQFVFEFALVQSEIEHRTDEHVAADAAECVEIKRFHSVWRRLFDRRVVWPVTTRRCKVR